MRSFFANKKNNPLTHTLSLSVPRKTRESHQPSAINSIDRPIDQPNNLISHPINTMPTNQQITAAREQGSDADATIRVGQQEQQHDLLLSYVRRIFIHFIIHQLSSSLHWTN
jgi:hypothetical protein